MEEGLLAVALLGGVRWPLALAGLYALLTAVALSAWWLVGDAWWNQLINLSTFWWALPSLPLLLLALVFRQWTPALLLLLPAGLLVWAYGGLFLPSSASSATSGGQAELRVVSYNTFIRAGSPAHVIDLVEERRPDVLLLQEVTPARAGQLRQGLRPALPHSWIGEGGAFGDVAVFSRHPIGEVRPIPGAEGFERPTAVVVIRVPGGERVRRVQVVPAHLVAPCPVCGPFIPRQRHEVESRSREISAVLSALDPQLPAIVAGDFNGTRRSDAYRALAATGFRDPHAEVGFGLGLTYPATRGPPAQEGESRTDGSGGVRAGSRATLAHLPLVSFPVLRLDHILVRDLVPLADDVGASRASDHRPVIADVAWPDRSGGTS